jgi:transposase-like protein
MSETFSKVEVITGVARQRRFTTEQKLLVVNETLQPGMSISYVARRHGLSPSLVFRWRRLMSEGGKEAVRADEDVVAASEVRRLEQRAAWSAKVVASSISLFVNGSTRVRVTTNMPTSVSSRSSGMPSIVR